MKHDPIRQAFEIIEPCIINTAAHYPEGRNILVYCLSRGAKRTEYEVLKWLHEEGVQIHKLHEYRIRDDSD